MRILTIAALVALAACSNAGGSINPSVPGNPTVSQTNIAPAACRSNWSLFTEAQLRTPSGDPVLQISAVRGVFQSVKVRSWLHSVPIAVWGDDNKQVLVYPGTNKNWNLHPTHNIYVQQQVDQPDKGKVRVRARSCKT